MENDGIGNLILRVNDDLNHLQDKLRTRQSQDKIDVGDIKDLLSSAQNGIQKRAEELLNHMNNQVTSFTNIDAGHSRSRPSLGSPINREYFEQINRMNFSNEQEIDFLPLEHISPGEIMKRDLALRNIANPQSRSNRNVAHDRMGIQLPLIEEKKVNKTSQNIQKGSMIHRLERLPLETNRNFNSQLPSKIQETDANRGLLNLIERGLIPPNAKITFDPPPVNNVTLNLNEYHDRYKTSTIPAVANDQGFSQGLYMMDETNAHCEDYLNDIDSTGEAPKLMKKSIMGENTNRLEERSPRKELNGNAGGKVRFNQKSILSKKDGQKFGFIKNLKFDEKLQIKERTVAILEQVEREETKPPATTPASQLSKSNMDAVHKFSIKDGVTREAADDFIRFKRHYCLSWGGIVTILKYMETFLGKYCIPLAFIDGDRVADLSVEFELELKPSEEDLFSCVINKKDVLYYIKQPGRRYKSSNGRDLAATVIQSKWRGYRAHQEYLEYRRKQWAAGVIAIQWILHMKMSHVRVELLKTREKQLLNSRKRFKNLSIRWPKMENSRRIIIHLPSIGIDEVSRSKMKRLPELQNYQMGRLCDLKDPNVDVVYICPVPINDEMLQYYSKLFALKSAVDSGDTTNQTPLTNRYRIIVPEAIKSFPTHNMCLSTLLKYSPRAINRIKNMIHGRTAWIVPGIVHQDDLDVADQLDVPILGTEPQILESCSTKSAIAKIFQVAAVATPPGANNIVSMDQLQETLTQLVVDHLNIKRWILKNNKDIKGQGIGYVDIDAHLSCYQWACKEQKRYGEKWIKGWAQENAYNRILTEIPRIVDQYLVVMDTRKYTTRSRYLKEFFKNGGGVLQAYPGCESVTNVTVSMMIDPVGKIEILNSGDQIHDGNNLNAWGYSVPQSSIDAEMINKACHKIGEICKYKLIRGYLSIDFVTFVEDNKENQYLWAIDIDFHYSDISSMVNLSHFIANTSFDPAEHLLSIQSGREEKDKDKAPLSLNRYLCLSTQLSNSNLSMVHYSVFFQMCRAHGIGYDIREKQGSVFGLIDSFNRENISMITIGPTLEGTLEAFAKNLYVLHQEISSPNMPGHGNFKDVIKEIESILGLVIENVLNNQDNAKT